MRNVVDKSCSENRNKYFMFSAFFFFFENRAVYDIMSDVAQYRNECVDRLVKIPDLKRHTRPICANRHTHEFNTGFPHANAPKMFIIWLPSCGSVSVNMR